MIKALILTVVIELFLLKLLKEKDYKVYGLSLMMNVVTNLSLNRIIQHLSFSHFYLYWVAIIALEIGVVLVEACGYFILYKTIKKSILISLFLNFVSATLGTFIYNII